MIAVHSTGLIVYGLGNYRLERSQQRETWICANIAVERKYLDMRREVILYGVLFTASLSANKE